MGSCTVQLNCLDSAEAVIVASVLWVHDGCEKCHFGHELVYLVVEVVVEIALEEAFDERRLRIITT